MITFAIIGCGLLGIKIAGELSKQGASIRMYDRDLSKRDETLTHINNDRKSLIDGGLISESHVMGQVLILNHLEDVLHGANIVIEAIVEDYIIKKQLFEDIDQLCSSTTILTSNTIEMNFSKIIENLSNKERTIGLRFLYPVYGINEVEITPTEYTSNKTLRTANKENEQFEVGIISNRRISTCSKTDSADGRVHCVICLTNERNTLLSPCNHIALCSVCADSVVARQEACPICRSRIREVVRVFHA